MKGQLCERTEHLEYSSLKLFTALCGVPCCCVTLLLFLWFFCGAKLYIKKGIFSLKKKVFWYVNVPLLDSSLCRLTGVPSVRHGGGSGSG